MHNWLPTLMFKFFTEKTHINLNENNRSALTHRLYIPKEAYKVTENNWSEINQKEQNFISVAFLYNSVS